MLPNLSLMSLLRWYPLQGIILLWEGEETFNEGEDSIGFIILVIHDRESYKLHLGK
jgi:hypothetical protein